MKTRRLLLAAILSAFTFISCSNEEDLNNPDKSNSIQFTSSIVDLKDSQYKAAGNVWDKNDEIGVCMLKNGMSLSASSLYAYNKRYKTEEGATTGVFTAVESTDVINYPEDDSSVDFIAYYPYRNTLTDNYLYTIDVSNQTSQAAIDFLYSNNATALNKTTKNVALSFKHKLTKLVFSITSENAANLSGLTITIKGTKTKAVYNLASDRGLSLDNTSASDIQAKVSVNGASGEAIILPDNEIEGRSFVFTLPSGDVFLWEIPTSTTFEEGKKYTYNVNLQRNNTVAISPNSTIIQDWIDGPTNTIIPEKIENVSPETGIVELDKLYGYGESTTGGEGGTVHHFNDGIKFRDWLKLREKNKSTDPAIVWLSGTFTKVDGRDNSSPWFDIKRTSNISIYGTNDFRMENVGFFLNGAENIILRNIYIVMPKADNGADGISMQESNRVWVDHCTFESVNQTSDYEDGSCDITHGTKNVTVSWNRFIKTQKTCLVGHSNSQTSDSQITATFHHNFFDQSNSRHPRVRFGKVHVYNNFYNKVATYGVGSAYGAMVLVEGNFFDGVRLPTDICTYPAKTGGVSNLEGSVAGYLYAADNSYINAPANASNPYPFTNIEFLAYGGSTLVTPLTRADFTPAYTYVVDKAEDVGNIVSIGAGVGKLPNFDTAPIAVNNGNMPDTGSETGGETDGEGNGESQTSLGGGWLAVDMGADGAAGVNTPGDNNSITMTGKGKFESGKQTFNFVYRDISGDFEITAQLENYSVTSTSNQAEAGLLLATSLTASATDLIFALCGKGGDQKCNYSHRLAAGNSSKGSLPSSTATSSSVFLKLKRVGNIYYASYSTDGGLTYSDEKSGTFTTAFPDTLYVGLVVNSGSATESATAKFSNIKINGADASFGN